MIRIRRKILIRMVIRLLVLLTLVGSFGYGFVCNERQLPPYSLVRKAYNWAQYNNTVRRVYFFWRRNVTHRNPGGRGDPVWNLATNLPGAEGLNPDQREAMAKLHAIGYMPGYEPAPEAKDVTTYVPGLAFDGFNLYASGHAPEAILMDMKGKVLHKWGYKFRDAFPDHPQPAGPWRMETWDRVHLYDNGDLLALFDMYGLIKLDKDSNLIWTVPGMFHHDLQVDRKGFIYALSGEVKIIPRIHEYDPVREDFVTVLDPDGNVVHAVSLLEAFERSSYASFLQKMPRFGDLFHTNTLKVLDGSHASRSSIFKKGNILISLRTLDVIAIVDMETEEVCWALSGQWLRQHEPMLLDNGNILLFDNLGHNGMSKVIEIDPFTQEIVWAYEGTAENGFYSEVSGRNQRLQNGNTLITEATSGRAFEVTRDGKIVWEFYNPARAGKNNELIATLFHCWRLGPDHSLAWLDQSADDL